MILLVFPIFDNVMVMLIAVVVWMTFVWFVFWFGNKLLDMFEPFL